MCVSYLDNLSHTSFRSVSPRSRFQQGVKRSNHCTACLGPENTI